MSRIDSDGLSFHHCRPLDSVRFGVISSRAPAHLTRGHLKSEPCDWSDPPHALILRDRPCAWLEAKVGFWPLFLAVGGSDAVSIETGYLDGDSSRNVLFSYSALEGAIALDHVAWHAVQDAVLMSDDGHPVPNIDEGQVRSIFRPDLTPDEWLLWAAAEPGSVLAITSRLDLRAASSIACHNHKVRDRLLDLGFEASRVHVWAPVPSWKQAAAGEIRKPA